MTSETSYSTVLHRCRDLVTHKRFMRLFKRFKSFEKSFTMVSLGDNKNHLQIFAIICICVFRIISSDICNI